MDFLDPKKKRAYKIRLYIGYFLMAVALSMATLILLFQAFGYDFNRKTGEVIQNGLVFVNSYPESARILINGKYKSTTNARFVLPADQYTIKLERTGYRPWQRTFELEGSIVERLTYPFIFPNQLAPKDIRPYTSLPAFATQSPDRHWLLIEQPGQLTSFDVVDLNSKDSTTTNFTLPEGLLSSTAGDQKLSLVEWSTDNRHVLLSHTFPPDAQNPIGQEFIMVDRQDPTQSFNVNRVFGTASLTQVALRDKKFDQLYLLDSSNTLKRADVSSRQTTPLATQVRAFKGYGDDILLYVTEEGAVPDKALAVVRQGNDVYKLSDLPRSNLYAVDLAQYDGHWYMAVGTDTDHRAVIYRDPFDDIARKTPRPAVPIAVLRLQQFQYLSFSANARFIGAQGGSEFSIYDAEHERQYRYDTKLKVPAGYKATWMDGFRYMVVNDAGQVVVFDYDGINTQTLTASTPAFLPFFNRDYDFLYTLGPAVAGQGRVGLMRAAMRTPQDQ